MRRMMTSWISSPTFSKATIAGPDGTSDGNPPKAYSDAVRSSSAKPQLARMYSSISAYATSYAESSVPSSALAIRAWAAGATLGGGERNERLGGRTYVLGGSADGRHLEVDLGLAELASLR